MKKTEAKVKMDQAQAHHLLKQMLRIRRLEQKSAEMYTQEKIRGFLHLYDGEEATAVGVIEQLKPEDSLFTTYREHGHALIRGVPAKCIMAELYGKQEGCSRGRGGSMHLFDVSRRFYGGYAIVGGALPPAMGMALALKKTNTKGVVVCFFGEGAVEEGEFHETMNLAALWQLPILFVCENNLYAMGMAIDRAESVTELTRKLESYNIPATSTDGMDILKVMDEARNALEYVRSGKGPYFLESKTYRFRAHSMFDAQLYRTKEEVEKWREKDPIKLFHEKLDAEGLITGEAFSLLDQEVVQEIEEATQYAEQGTDEPVEDLTRFVYSENKKL